MQQLDLPVGKWLDDLDKLVGILTREVAAATEFGVVMPGAPSDAVTPTGWRASVLEEAYFKREFVSSCQWHTRSQTCQAGAPLMTRVDHQLKLSPPVWQGKRRRSFGKAFCIIHAHDS